MVFRLSRVLCFSDEPSAERMEIASERRFPGTTTATPSARI